MYIESLNNSHVKEWLKLKTKKYRDQECLFLIEGEHLIEEAQKKNCLKEIISQDPNLKADYYVSPVIMKKICSQESSPSRMAVCFKIPEQPLQNKILVLDGIQDPGNLGTIIRSAVAFAFDTIVLSNDTVDLYNEKVIRSSEGMLFHINIIRTDLIPFLKQEQNTYTIFGTDVHRGQAIRKLQMPPNFMLVIGNEGKGIKPEIKELCHQFINLPMTKNCESLNAAVAASILMYECFEGLNE